MKSPFYIIAIGVIAITTVLSSCKKTEEVLPPPAIGAVAKSGYLTGNTTIQNGDSVKICWAAVKGGSELATSTVTLNGVEFSGFNGGKAKTMNDNQKNGYTDEIKFKPNATGDYNFRITATDGKSASFTITVVVPRILKEFKSQILGTNTTSYFSSITGLLYQEADFISNKSKIDITFAQTGTSAKTILLLLSSAQRSAEGLSTGTSGTSNYFKKSILNYDLLTEPQINEINSSVSTQKIEITNGGIYEFLNAAGNKGLIRVNGIALDPAGVNTTINISVKVQQ